MIYGREKFYGCEKPILIGKMKNFSLIKLVYVVFFNSNTIKAKQTIMDSNFNRIAFLLELHIKNKEHVCD